MNLNSLDNSRTHGAPPKSKWSINVRTKNNLATLEPDTCFMCNGPVLNGFCECNIDNPPPTSAPREPQLLKVDSEHYVIDSFTTEGVTYDLTRNEYGVWLCTCPAFAFRYECKHCDTLLAHLGARVVPVVPKRKLQLEDLYSWVDDIAS